MNENKRKGLMLVLSSPSGAGKLHLQENPELDKKILMSISYTTRLQRKSEKEGVDYFLFVSKKFLTL